MKNRLLPLFACAALFFSLPGCSAPSGSGMQEHSITFPASDQGVTEFNSAVFEIEPFVLTLELPEGWDLQVAEPGASVYAHNLWSPVNILEDGDCIGSIAYNTFTPYPDAGDNPRAIYNQIMLSGHCSWEHDYTVLDRTDDLITAACRVGYSETGYDAARLEQPWEPDDDDMMYNQGILSCSQELSVYVGIEIRDGHVPDGRLDAIAQSIRLTASQENS